MARDFRAPGTLRCIGTYFLLFYSTALLGRFRFIGPHACFHVRQQMVLGDSTTIVAQHSF